MMSNRSVSENVGRDWRQVRNVGLERQGVNRAERPEQTRNADPGRRIRVAVQ